MKATIISLLFLIFSGENINIKEFSSSFSYENKLENEQKLNKKI